jgi:hypothetical protein
MFFKNNSVAFAYDGVKRDLNLTTKPNTGSLNTRMITAKAARTEIINGTNSSLNNCSSSR